MNCIQALSLTVLVAAVLAPAASGQSVSRSKARSSRATAPSNIALASRANEWVTPERAVVTGDEVVASARRFIGTPYRLGGANPRAFDCSGFVQYVFALHGVSLPRTAHEQAAVGEAPVGGDSLEAGDLLFFWGGHGAQHIAIYVGGDSIIHASSTGHKVRVDRLTGQGGMHSTWFNERLIAVRRLLPADGITYVSATATPYSFMTKPAPQW